MNPFVCLSFGQVMMSVLRIHLVVMNRTFLTEQAGGYLHARAECGLYHTSLANDDWMALLPIPAVLTALITLWELRSSQIWGENSPSIGSEACERRPVRLLHNAQTLLRLQKLNLLTILTHSSHRILFHPYLRIYSPACSFAPRLNIPV